MASKQEILSNISQALATTPMYLYSSRLRDFTLYQNLCLSPGEGVAFFAKSSELLSLSLLHPTPSPLFISLLNDYSWANLKRQIWFALLTSWLSALSRLPVLLEKQVITTQAFSVLNTIPLPFLFPKENLHSYLTLALTFRENSLAAV